MSDRVYRLNRNPARKHVLHGDRTFEECNVDDAIDREVVDELTARALVDQGLARTCEHCLTDGLLEE